MNTLEATSHSEHSGIYKVKQLVKEVIDVGALKWQLYEKQKLYAQMKKDGITSKALLDQLSEEINDIRIKLYHYAKSKR